MNYPVSLDESSTMEAYPTSPSNDKHYPKLRLHWDKKYDLPEHGTMTVRFYKCEQTDTEREGKISQSVELDILTIESVKADKEPPKKSPRAEAEEALDLYASEAEEG